MSDRGSATLLHLAILLLAAALIVVTITTATVLGTRAKAQAAADAAALAAAPVTFRPFGATGSARQEAERFASMHGARLVACACPPDPSFATRIVRVSVTIDVRVPIVGSIEIPATAAAEFAPIKLLRIRR